MALFGIYGKHTVDACPWNNIETARMLKTFAESDIGPLAKKYKINSIDWTISYGTGTFFSMGRGR